MTHTVPPWQVIEDDDGSFNLHSDTPAGELMDYIGAIENHEDAAFIVRAVNCHDELVEALTWIDEILNSDDYGLEEKVTLVRNRTRAALNTPAVRGGE